MKIASVKVEAEDLLVFEGSKDDICSLPAALQVATGTAPDWSRDMLALIEAGTEALDGLAQVGELLARRPHAIEPLRQESIVWYPPVRRPSKICCLALNNSANADRIMSGPAHPAVFLKAANALVGHGEPIVVKEHYGRVHPEPELAVIIGKTARNVKASEALQYVFGYTIHNDITSPTMRKEDTVHYRAIHPKMGDDDAIEYVDTFVSYSGRYKCSDTFSPMGPGLPCATRCPIPTPFRSAATTRESW